jgi:RHS repeat-associated protein
MAMKARYTVVDGEVIAEKRGGARKLYVPDPLGSTVALLDNTRAQTDTFTYWPYGEERSRTGTTATPFRFVGTEGYYRDSANRSYVRARYLDSEKGRWLTPDPIGYDGGDWNMYRYAVGDPVGVIDASGLQTPIPFGHGCHPVPGPFRRPMPPPRPRLEDWFPKRAPTPKPSPRPNPPPGSKPVPPPLGEGNGRRRRRRQCEPLWISCWNQCHDQKGPLAAACDSLPEPMRSGCLRSILGDYKCCRDWCNDSKSRCEREPQEGPVPTWNCDNFTQPTWPWG